MNQEEKIDNWQFFNFQHLAINSKTALSKAQCQYKKYKRLNKDYLTKKVFEHVFDEPKPETFEMTRRNCLRRILRDFQLTKKINGKKRQSDAISEKQLLKKIKTLNFRNFNQIKKELGNFQRTVSDYTNKYHIPEETIETEIEYFYLFKFWVEFNENEEKEPELLSTAESSSENILDQFADRDPIEIYMAQFVS